MLVEVKKTIEDNDRFKEVLLSESGPFLVVIASCDKGMNSDLTNVRLLARTENGYNVSALHIPLDNKLTHASNDISWKYNLQQVLENYRLLPKGYQITLTQTV